MAKGAGMLAPGLATMLCVITTDADVDPADARRGAARPRPGSPSTASTPTAACRPTTPWCCWPAAHRASRPSRTSSPTALRAVCADLARPADRRRRGRDARRSRSRSSGRPPRTTRSRSAARIARNNLLKCALFGNDPNWGRVLAAIGHHRRRLRPGPARRRRSTASRSAAAGRPASRATRSTSPGATCT